MLINETPRRPFGWEYVEQPGKATVDSPSEPEPQTTEKTAVEAPEVFGDVVVDTLVETREQPEPEVAAPAKPRTRKIKMEND